MLSRGDTKTTASADWLLCYQLAATTGILRLRQTRNTLIFRFTFPAILFNREPWHTVTTTYGIFFWLKAWGAVPPATTTIIRRK